MAWPPSRSARSSPTHVEETPWPAVGAADRRRAALCVARVRGHERRSLHHGAGEARDRLCHPRQCAEKDRSLVIRPVAPIQQRRSGSPPDGTAAQPTAEQRPSPTVISRQTTGTVLAQHAVAAKTNETPMLGTRLDTIDSTGAVITADAPHRRRDTAEAIVCRRRLLHLDRQGLMHMLGPAPSPTVHRTQTDPNAPKSSAPPPPVGPRHQSAPASAPSTATTAPQTRRATTPAVSPVRQTTLDATKPSFAEDLTGTRRRQTGWPRGTTPAVSGEARPGLRLDEVNIAASGDFWLPDRPDETVRGTFQADAGEPPEAVLADALVEDPRVSCTANDGLMYVRGPAGGVKASLPTTMQGRLDSGESATLINAQNWGDPDPPIRVFRLPGAQRHCGRAPHKWSRAAVRRDAFSLR